MPERRALGLPDEGVDRAGPRPDAPAVLGEPLSLADVVDVAEGRPVALSQSAVHRMQETRSVVERYLRSGAVVYGITTGFGSLAGVRLAASQAEELQHGLLRSHAVGTGDPLGPTEVRAMMALRAQTLALGHSGVRPALAEAFVELLNRQVCPVVPEQGSLGASGDLAPLAHLALVVVGEGEAVVDGERVAGHEALRRVGLAPLRLAAKEGLSLINGTQGMTAIGILACHRLRRLLATADVAAAMTTEALLGTDRAFDPAVVGLRPHPGAGRSALNLTRLLAGSEIVASHRASLHLVQDAYSLRCVPQVHGAARDVLDFAEEVLTREVNGASDNPLVLLEGADAGEVRSAGNFHGQPVAVALDALAVATVGVASMAERRLYRILDPTTSNGLPPFLVQSAGLNSGFMVLQYTAASLVSEAKGLAHPASVDSIPSSAGQEDHVSMGMIAARHARGCVDLAERVVAAEILAAAQGLDLRRPLRPAPATAAVRDRLRQSVPALGGDRWLAPDLATATALVRRGDLLEAAQEVVELT